MAHLTVAHESWPIRGSFTISRGSRTTAEVVVAALEENGHRGRGECVPYAHYGESVESVISEIEAMRGDLAQGVTPEDLLTLMPAGAARAAVDCALWDLMAKTQGKRVWELLDQPAPKPMTTAYTLSLDTPQAMGQTAGEAAAFPLLKLKLGSGDIALDLDRVRAVRTARPDARIVVDANEAWSIDELRNASPDLAKARVTLIEQPLPAGADDALENYDCPVVLCADESVHDTHGFNDLVGRYRMINIKLNKTGGLTEALRLKAMAEKAGMGVMVGCMLGTSLAMAPAILVAGGADVVDLDGPLLLARDRDPGLRYDGAIMFPPDPALWG